MLVSVNAEAGPHLQWILNRQRREHPPFDREEVFILEGRLAAMEQ